MTLGERALVHTFQILGPLELRRDGTKIPLGAGKQQIFLLLLLLNPNRSVPISDLNDALWPYGPPASSRSNLRSYATALRRCFAGLDHIRLVADSGAYLLVVPPEQLDLTRYEQLVAQGREAMDQDDHVAALDRFDRAMVLWRGRVGRGLSYGKPVAAHVDLLHEERVTALLDRATVQLAVGRFAKVAVGMRALLKDHPTRERAWELLMRALYASGDAAGALRAFDEARTMVSTAQGSMQRLDRLRQAILREQPDLAPEDWPRA